MKGSRSVSRQEKILQILFKEKTVSVLELSTTLDVSGWTIRRELNKMVDQHLVERSRGHVTLIETPDHLALLQETVNAPLTDPRLQAKKRIGETAVITLRHFNTIALGAGSTTTQVAYALKPYANLRIMTNGLNIAMVLSRQDNIELICTGGSVHGSYYTLTGPEAERTLRAHYFDVAVIGVSGFAIKEGLTVNSQLNAFTLRIMLEQSRQVMVVADHTKLGAVSFAFLAPVTAVDWLVTDMRPDPQFCEQLEASEVDLIVAGK